jgi:hypothetical protein
MRSLGLRFLFLYWFRSKTVLHNRATRFMFHALVLIVHTETDRGSCRFLGQKDLLSANRVTGFRESWGFIQIWGEKKLGCTERCIFSVATTLARTAARISPLI